MDESERTLAKRLSLVVLRTLSEIKARTGSKAKSSENVPRLLSCLECSDSPRGNFSTVRS